jgi:hypothetical protein
VFIGTAFIRYMSVAGFTNDQFEHLAGAQQMLFGEWPTRDFADPGMPLTYAMSALAQLLLGRTLFAEAVLNACAFGMAAACTLIGAYRLSRSLVVAIVAAALCVALFPRGYAYPRVLVTAAGPLVIWAWMASPTARRTLAAALAVVVAFLFRYDCGIYLGAASVAGIAMAPAASPRERCARIGLFCAIVAAMLLPYALYLQASGGFIAAVRSVVEYGQRHAQRTQLHFAQMPWSGQTELFYAFHAMPLVAIVVVFAGLPSRRVDPRLLAPLIVLAVVVNAGFLRDPLEYRLADAAVPSILLAAWLAGCAWRVVRIGPRVIAVAAVAVFSIMGARTVFAVGRVAVEWDHSNLARGWRFVPRRIRGQTLELQAWDVARQSPNPMVTTLFPFFAYVDRCTTQNQRLLVTGYAPEVYVYAHRAFAGGQKVFMQGYFDSRGDQELVIRRIRHQNVPLVLQISDDLEWWRRDFAIVDAFISSNYQPMADIPIHGERSIRILVNPSLPPVRVDAATGWPCYR